MTKSLICINCPHGCHLTATWNEAENTWDISGNFCPAGANYGKNELTNPKRVVTAVVQTDVAEHPYLPVRTDLPYPKKDIAALLNRIYAMTVTAPVKIGDVIIADIEGSGVNLIASENL